MDLEKHKIWIYGILGVIAIVLIAKLAGKKAPTSGGGQLPTGQITNLSPQDPTASQQILAQYNLGMQQAKLAGLSSLLDYSTQGQTLASGERVQTLALNNQVAINSTNVGRDIQVATLQTQSQDLQAQLQAQATEQAAALQAQAAEAAVQAQVQIAGIGADVQNKQTAANLTLGLRGYSSQDFQTAAQQNVSLAQINEQNFEAGKNFDLQTLLARYGFKLGKKEIQAQNAETQAGVDIAQINATTQQYIAHQQASAAKTQGLFGFLSSALGPLAGLFGG